MVKIVVSSKVLGTALAKLEKVTDSKNVMPILNDVIVTVSDNTLLLTAANIENQMEMQVEAVELEGNGTFGVNIRDLGRAVASLPECPICLTQKGDENVITVNYGLGEFCLPVDDAKDFPVTPELSEEHTSFTMKDSDLKKVIARTIECTAQDELRPVMGAVHFELTEEALEVVASNGHRLALSRLLSVKSDKPASFNLPKKPSAVLKGIATSDTDVIIRFDERNVEIVTADCTLKARLIEGRYPNYNSVIPKNHKFTVGIDRNTLISTTSRLIPFANQASCLMRVTIEGNIMTLATEDWDFSKNAQETIPCESDVEKISIGLKGSSVVELLKTISSEKVNIELTDATRAAILRPAEQPENEDILLLQMPMLLND